jgi:PAS domain S-box-containing protein
MKEQLLIVDDEPFILSSLEHLFEDQYQVFATADAEAALRLAREHDIAVILCDERMPGVSGHEFLRRVREVSRATRIMMSGYTDFGALAEAVNSGQIFAYLPKPWEPLTLKSLVSTAVIQFKLVHEVDQERGLLRALMENIPDLIYFKDRESRFTRVNQAHARALGSKDAAECVGKSDADFFPSEDALRWRRQEEEIVRSGLADADRIEQLKFPERGLRWMSTTKAPMFQRNGQVSGIAGISRDITALKATEQELQRAKASAESANRVKSEFLTTVSHEMRTPMNAILGMAGVLVESELPKEHLDYVRIVQKAGAHLLVLINDILDLSKIESGHLELESIAFDLHALLESIIELLRAQARDRGLQLTLEIRPGVPSRLVGDPHRLRQILDNLVGNALKFTKQGSVTLRVEPDPEGAAGSLRFNVVDTGIGIPADKIDIIFERFTQADSSITRKYGGTGLGLAISKGLAELMKGRIGCASEMGKGSTFSLTVPFETRPAFEASPLTEPLASLGTRLAGQEPAPRVLIVDDLEDNVMLLEVYLKDCGFELEVAENGQVAVEKVMAHRPDLVLMDLQMPVMDGFEATRAIRRWEAETQSPPIPILALTAHTRAEHAHTSQEAGCTEHLTKPIERTALLAAIFRHLHGEGRVSPPPGIDGRPPSYLEV